MGVNEKKGRVATVGTFDGLHRGHRKVIETVNSIAGNKNLKPLAVCFDRHPLETIAPERAPGFIQAPSERINALYREGFEILTLEFNHATAGLTAEEWLTMMRDRHGVDTLVVGYDNTFGSDGIQMSIHDYQALGRRLGMEVVEAPIQPGVSSSAIRRLIASGDIEGATQMLGHPYTMTGEVAHGKGLGSRIGVPTANLRLPYRAQLPANGVYAAEAILPDGSVHKAVVNIGVRPTVDTNGEKSIEAHIIGFNGDIYGQRLTLKLIRKLRDEKRFDSLEGLQRQIQEDIVSMSDGGA